MFAQRCRNSIKRCTHYGICNWLGLIQSSVSIAEYVYRIRRIDTIQEVIWRETFKFESDKYKAISAHLFKHLPYLLKRLRAFRRLVEKLASTCGATIRVNIVVSCSCTSRVAKAQKGLTCPIGHIERIFLRDHSDE